MTDAVGDSIAEARALLAQRNQAGAIAVLERALPRAPGDANLVALLAENYARSERYPQARALLLKFCADHTPDVASLRQIGGWFFRSGDHAAAVSVFEHWCQRDPGNADALISLGSARQMLGHNAVAAKYYRAALAIDAGRADAWSNLGTAYQGEQNLERAHECYSKALALDAGNSEAVAGLVSVLDLGGDTQSALALLDAHRERAHTNVELAILSARLRRRNADAAGSEAVAAAALKATGLSRAQASRLSFALADALDAQDRTDEAFATYQRANQLRAVRFDVASHGDFFEHLKLQHAAKISGPLAPAAEPAPLFIVGMPRSGTTLIEQMLSCHSSVYAAGERRALPATVAAMTPRHARYPYPLDPQALPEEIVRQAAERYRGGLGAAADAQWVTDKLPGNFIYLGLIPLLFPNARVVHCQRDPLDVGLSLFCNDFAQAALPFAYSLEHIGHYYLQYRGLMTHWQSIEPLPLINVRYEDLVCDPRAQMGRILSFMDEPFEDAVLDFHASKRVALTASNDQVRQPLYTSSIGRAERYRAHLQPLRQLLDAAGEAYGDAW